LLDFLVAQNEAAQEKIESYSYTLEDKWLGSSGMVFEGTAQVKQQGDNFWTKYTRTGLNETAGEMQEREIRIVVNDKYAAVLPMMGNPIAYQRDYTSFESMDARTKSLLKGTTPFDCLSYAFGAGSRRSFREAMKVYPDKIKWDAIKTQDINEKTLYQIQRFMPPEAEGGDYWLEKIWNLDPQKGFVVSESTTYHPDGNVWFQRSMQIEEVSEGAWFPVAYREDRYPKTASDSEKNKKARWKEITLKDMKVNQEFPKEQFEIDALNLKEDQPDIIVLRTGLDGKKVPYIYHNGKLLPQEIVNGLERAIAFELNSEKHSPSPTSPTTSTTLPEEPPKATLSQTKDDLSAKKGDDQVPVKQNESVSDDNNQHRSIIKVLTVSLCALIVLTVIVYSLSRREK